MKILLIDGHQKEKLLLRPDEVLSGLLAAPVLESARGTIERALGVPVKRFERPIFKYLSREKMLAVIGTFNPVAALR